MAKDKLIELLNEALQYEYDDVFIYPREAQIVKDKQTAEIFERFGKMELRHADNLSQQIQSLGGKAKWDFMPLEIKESVEEMLQGHLQREGGGIQYYDNLIKVANEAGEDQLKLVLQGIKSEEEGHFRVVKELLDKKK